MPVLAQHLLSAALRVRWEDHPASDRDAVRRLSERVPGFDDAQYAEALNRAEDLNSQAYDLAAAWFAARGRPEAWPRVVDLGGLCPGFTWNDYEEAIEKNILWARK
jgi:hypothetical protein